MQKKNIQVALLNLNVGNVYSLKKSLNYLDYNVNVTDESKKIISSDVVFLPGDSNFGFFMQAITKRNLKDSILEVLYKKKYLFGICAGFQALFENSEETPAIHGLGFLPGKLTKFSNKKLRVPHIGWEKTTLLNHSKLFQEMENHEYFYYIHSYCYNTMHQYALGTSNYELEFTSIINKDNIFGTQFHPEKSGKIGIQLLKNFMEIVQG